MLTALSLDAMSGNWDFAWGPTYLKALVRKLSYRLSACNCYDEHGGAPVFPAARVIERGPLRIGAIGLAATGVDESMTPRFSEGIRLTSGIEERPGHIGRLRRDEGADVVVVLSHLGPPQDTKLAQMVRGIDVLLSGHTHNRLAAPSTIGDTLLIQPGCHASSLEQIELDVPGGGGVGLRQHTLVPIDHRIPEDAAKAALGDEASASLRAGLSGAAVIQTRRCTARRCWMRRWTISC